VRWLVNGRTYQGRQTRAPATHLIGIPGSNSGAGTGAGSGDGTSAVRPLRSSTFIPRGRPGLDTPQPSDPQTADNVPRAATREELVQGHSSDSRIRGNVDGRVLPIPISSSEFARPMQFRFFLKF
jgi:hypothetical protein